MVVLLIVTNSTRAAGSANSIEIIMGFFHNDKGISFQVYDGGCTQKSDFSALVSNKDGQLIVSLIRNSPDLCRTFSPYGRMINYSYEELGISRKQVFQIDNPINPGFIQYY